MSQADLDLLNPTASGSGAATETGSAPEPGLVMVFAANQALCTLFPIGTEPLELGRGHELLANHPDALMSRRHARVTCQDGTFEVTELGSRNGSAIDGFPLEGTAKVASGALLRLGGSLFSFCHDLGPFRRFGITRVNERVLGPALRILQHTVTHIASSSRTLFILGESGTGKESLAHEYHSEGPQRRGPFVAVNCAAIPEGIAERLLLGSRKGAFSGAVTDSPGYIEAADGGTLFLDEIADLDMAVQGKLLRVIETGELLTLGATRPQKVQVRICAATNKDLRALTRQGKFRSDLYFRIGMPQISIPPLRQRKEEIPWLITGAAGVSVPPLPVDVSLVEKCILRPWPGNIRELLTEINTAAILARAAGKKTISAEQLGASAGLPIHSKRGAAGQAPLCGPTSTPLPHPPAPSPLTFSPGPQQAPSRERVVAVLIEARGNVSAAARLLQMHRTQLQRLLTRYKIDVEKLRESGCI